MTLFVYQLGDVPLWDTLRSVDGDSIEMEIERTWRLPKREASGVSGNLYYTNLDRLQESSEIEISGSLISDSVLNPSLAYRRLVGLGGHGFIPLIAFELVQGDSNYDNGTYLASEVRWMFCYVHITSVGYKNSYGMNVIKDTSVIEVEISMEQQTNWQGLSRHEWQYLERGGGLITYQNSFINNVVKGTQFSDFPKTLDTLNKGLFFRHFKINESLHDFPSIADLQDIEKGFASMDFTTLSLRSVFINPYLWSAPAEVVYLFKNIVGTGTLSITTTNSNGIIGVRSVSFEFDIESTNNRLSEYGLDPITATDIVVIGDVGDNSPSYIYRNGGIIDQVRPEINIGSHGHSILDAGQNDIHARGNNAYADWGYFVRMFA